MGPCASRWWSTANSGQRRPLSPRLRPSRHAEARARRKIKEPEPGAERRVAGFGFAGCAWCLDGVHSATRMLSDLNHLYLITVGYYSHASARATKDTGDEGMETLTLIPIEDSVVFPGMTVTLALEVGEEERVFLVPRSGEHFASVGTVARVVERLQIPGGGAGRDPRGASPRRRRPRRRRHGRRAAGRGDRASRRRPATERAASSRASTARWSRRSSSCATPTRGSAPSCARSPSRARWPTPRATRPT